MRIINVRSAMQNICFKALVAQPRFAFHTKIWKTTDAKRTLSTAVPRVRIINDKAYVGPNLIPCEKSVEKLTESAMREIGKKMPDALPEVKEALFEYLKDVFRLSLTDSSIFVSGCEIEISKDLAFCYLSNEQLADKIPTFKVFVSSEMLHLSLNNAAATIDVAVREKITKSYS